MDSVPWGIPFQIISLCWKWPFSLKCKFFNWTDPNPSYMCTQAEWGCSWMEGTIWSWQGSWAFEHTGSLIFQLVGHLGYFYEFCSNSPCNHIHTCCKGELNTLEDARAESPSRNIQKGKRNCQELPFSSTPALFILPTDQFSMLSSSGSYKQWGLGNSGSMVGSSGDKHFWEQTRQAILYQWLWVLQGSACNTEINTGLSCI